MNSLPVRLTLGALALIIVAGGLAWSLASYLTKDSNTQAAHPADVQQQAAGETANPAILGVALGSTFRNAGSHIHEAGLKESSSTIANSPTDYSIRYVAGTPHPMDVQQFTGKLACDPRYQLDYQTSGPCTVAVFHGMAPDHLSPMTEFDKHIIWRADLYQRFDGSTPLQTIRAAMTKRWGEPRTETSTHETEVRESAVGTTRPPQTRSYVVHWLVWGGKGDFRSSKPPSNPLDGRREGLPCKDSGCSAVDSLLAKLPFDADGMNGKVMVAVLTGSTENISEVYVSAADLDVARRMDELINTRRKEADEHAREQKEKARLKSNGKMLRY
jgi:hypothetical protein